MKQTVRLAESLDPAEQARLVRLESRFYEDAYNAVRAEFPGEGELAQRIAQRILRAFRDAYDAEVLR